MIWYDLILKHVFLCGNFLFCSDELLGPYKHGKDGFYLFCGNLYLVLLRAFPVLKNKLPTSSLLWRFVVWFDIWKGATPEEILNARTSNAQTLFPGKINWYLVRFPPISDIQSMNSADNSFGNLDVCAYWNMQQAINARPSIATDDIITQERVIERCVIVSISSSRHNQCISKEPGGQKQPSNPAFGCQCIWQQKNWMKSRKDREERASWKKGDWGFLGFKKRFPLNSVMSSTSLNNLHPIL